MRPSPDSEATTDPSAAPGGPAPTGVRSRVGRKGIAAVALVAVGALVGASTAIAADQFSDVPESNPFHGDIGWAADNGLVGGYQDGTYRPTNPISRQAIAPMLRRLAGADPSVDPMVTADGVEVFRASAPNTTITSTSSQSPNEVATVGLEAPATYLVHISAEVQTAQDYATVSCALRDVPVLADAAFFVDLQEGVRYRENVTSFGLIETSGADLTIGCHKSGVSGPGSTSVHQLKVVAIKVADQPTRGG